MNDFKLKNNLSPYDMDFKPRRFPWWLFSRIVIVQTLLVLIALGTSWIAARYFFKRQFLSQVANQLHTSLESLSQDLPQVPDQKWCVSHSHDPSLRLTVISQNGAVLCDSHHDPQSMENHLTRPEVQEALRSGFGQSIRYSATLSENMLYGAIHVKELIFRGAIPLLNLVATLHVLDMYFALFVGLIALILVLFSIWSGIKLAVPIGRNLDEKTESAKRVEKMRIDFVANVSHELRTPLTAIKGYTDTISHDIEAGRSVSKEFVDIISRNTSRLMSLINDLLDLSSLDANVDDLQKTDLSTREVSLRVVKQLQGTFESKKQITIVDVKCTTVLADPRRIEQVLVNLLDNASKYTPTGGRITILWEKDSVSNNVLMKVSDTGPGIPQEHHDRLFERFYRIDKARSRELGGTGLGLAIVKHIMQRHGGTVWVESVVGHGATFICKFPA